MGGGHLSRGAGEPISLEAVFERFPASVRGALVVRGADPDPHQIQISEVSVIEAHGSGRSIRPVPLGPVTADVPPRGEVLVPFDIPFAGLDPGWYAVSAEVEVDGQRRIRGPAQGERRFVVPWPGGTVRRGKIEAGVRVDVAGQRAAEVEQVDCRADRAVVRWRAIGGRDPGDLRVLAAGRRLPHLGSSEGPEDERSTVVFPILRRYRQLAFELVRPRGGGRGRATLDLG